MSWQISKVSIQNNDKKIPISRAKKRHGSTCPPPPSITKEYFTKIRLGLITLSHLSTHFEWNSWAQGSTRTSCRVSKSHIQTTQTVWSSFSEPSHEYLNKKFIRNLRFFLIRPEIEMKKKIFLYFRLNIIRLQSKIILGHVNYIG